MTGALFQAESQGMRRWRRLIHWLGLFALAALALTPLIIDRAALDDAFMTPKWAWIASTGLLLAAALGMRFTAGRALMLPFDAVFIAAVLWLVWHWIAVAWAPSESLAFERAQRIGWMTLALWGAVQWLGRRRVLLSMAWLLIAIGCVTAAWTLLEDFIHAFAPQHQWVVSNLADWRGYLAAGLGNTNHIGDLVVLTLIPALVMFGEARRKGALALLGAACVLLPAALIVSYSVGSLLGLLVAAAVMLGVIVTHGGLRWFTRRRGRWIALLMAWAVVIGFFVIEHPLNPHRPGIIAQGFGSERWHAGGPTRLAIWGQSLEMIRLYPIWGAGTGNFTYVYPEMNSALLAGREDLLVYQGLWTNAAHNALLQAWAELGVLGLFLLLTLAGLAFFTIFHGLGRADRPGLLIRLTLGGMLAAYAAQAQMNFTLQHPAGLLLFYSILAAIVIEKRTRPREGGAMPSLRWETDWLALRVDWHSMRKPTGLGAALLLPEKVAMGAGGVLLIAALVYLPALWRPVLAQREYRRAVAAARVNATAQAEAYYEKALLYYPDAHDVRSSYSEWLLRQGRPAETLEELELVRERLNSNELWLRQAQALRQLGRMEEAQASYTIWRTRLWQARQFAPERME